MSEPATSYWTVDAAPGEGVDVELEIKRSRFLTRLRRVTSEAAARVVIEERRKHYFDARHHCTAFRLGPQARVARSSDDGEPAGTAGVPMLNVLQNQHLTDVVAVVTRYFGGIKLGAGGLVRAYSDAVAQAVAAAGKRRVLLMQLVGLDVALADAGSLEAQLRASTLPSGAPIVVDEVTWGELVHLRLAIPNQARAELTEHLAAMTGGSVQLSDEGQRWTDSPN